MVNDEIVISIALIFAVVVLILVKIIEFFVRFNNDTRYITREMRRAYDDGEYRYWRRELRCHYLCLIPFVNERNVMQLYKKIYHKAKHNKAVKRSDGLYHILAPSAIGICICAVCLCGASWAWFTATQTSSVTGIHTATYTVNVTAATDETQAKVTSNSGIYTVSLESGKAYKITITANGTANTGFCTVALGEQTYHTPQIEKNNIFTFEVNTYQSGVLPPILILSKEVSHKTLFATKNILKKFFVQLHLSNICSYKSYHESTVKSRNFACCVF